MHALVEYKKQVDTIGDGDFNLGRTKMWSNIPIIETWSANLFMGNKMWSNIPIIETWSANN